MGHPGSAKFPRSYRISNVCTYVRYLFVLLLQNHQCFKTDVLYYEGNNIFLQGKYVYYFVARTQSNKCTTGKYCARCQGQLVSFGKGSICTRKLRVLDQYSLIAKRSTECNYPS